MDVERWARVRAVFEAVLAAPPDQQTGVLEEACGDDPELRAAVDAMLRADRAASRTDRPLAQATPDLIDALAEENLARQESEMRGRRLGAWKLQHEIGRGGMGAVYLAERDDGQYVQQAAVKLVRGGWDAGALLVRLRAERQILASLNHPNIARLLDGGVSEEGAPYLVLEYVAGQPINQHCDEHRLDLRARLALFLEVCGAVAHAHRHLVVHRDIKPSNILVNREGQVKLLDFGIAKLLDASGNAHSMQRLFTPEYAAPEQVRGEPATTGVDVYASGLLLYELITGQRPYGKTASTPAAYEHAILTEPPERPSRTARLLPAADATRLAGLRKLSAGEWHDALRGDLDAIVLQALRKEPGQRYESMQALMEDVRRHLERRPVLARSGTWRYAAGRFVQRHALAVTLAAVAVLGVLGGAAAALWQASEAQAARARAEREAGIATATAEFMTLVFSLADPAASGTRDPTAREVLDRGLAQLEADATLDEPTRLALLAAIANAYSGLHEPAAAQPVLERALALASRIDDVKRQMELQASLAVVLNNSGHYDEALSHLQAARRRFEQLKWKDGELAARLDYINALTLLNLRRNTEALPFLRRAYDYRLAAHGPMSEEVNVMISLYATTLVGNGLAAEAVDVTTRLYEAARDNPEVTRTKLSNILDAQGNAFIGAQRYPEAEATFRKSLAIDRALYGERHFRTGYALNNLAVSLQRQGRAGEAALLFDELAQIRKEQLPVTDSGIGSSLLSAGGAYEVSGDDVTAEARLREGSAAWKASGATLTTRYLRGMLALIRVLERRGEIDEAWQRISELQPFVDGELKHQTGTMLPELLLLKARLAERREVKDPENSRGR
jgi:eukaryotic-like serine/threonine-protein kinase